MNFLKIGEMCSTYAMPLSSENSSSEKDTDLGNSHSASESDHIDLANACLINVCKLGKLINFYHQQRSSFVININTNINFNAHAYYSFG